MRTAGYYFDSTYGAFGHVWLYLLLDTFDLNRLLIHVVLSALSDKFDCRSRSHNRVCVSDMREAEN